MKKAPVVEEAPSTEIQVAQPIDTNQSGTTAVAELDDLTQAFADTAGAGLEDFSSGDFAIPFLTVLQKNSPQVDETDGRYIPGAKPGMLFNTVTGSLFDCACLPGRPEPEGLTVVPAAMQRWMVEWRPRPQGGYVGQHEVDSPAHRGAKPHAEKKSLLTLSNGNDLADTMYFYVVLDLPDGPEWSVLALTSTMLSEAKRWSTKISSSKVLIQGVYKRAAIFGQSYKLHTKVQENDYGSWMGIRVTANGLVKDRGIFEAGRLYRDAVNSGRAKATAPPEDGAGQQSADNGNAGTGSGEETPF